MNLNLFNVSPTVPANLRFLEVLSHNMWWCWNNDAIDLFRRMNPELWRASEHNPMLFMNKLPPERLEALSKDAGFLQQLQDVQKNFESSVAGSSVDSVKQGPCIAYFSLEYGIHESIRNYSGGLGVLAGDHLKAASDMDVPLVAVGLMYRQGFFQQYLSTDGSQQEHYPENELNQMPLQKACDASQSPVQVTVPLPDGILRANVWKLGVGRVPLYLLDANIPENQPAYRAITAQLYGGGREIRLRQELLLGIGGVRALLQLGYDPQVSHTNEGHAAFLSLAQMSHLIKEHGVDYRAALEIVPRTNVFTTHTPVPAGNEVFKLSLAKPHLEALEKELGIATADVIGWGQSEKERERDELSMTVLGLRMAQCSNGVSKLHGEVARSMWAHLWPGRPIDEIPIGHVTNGIHVSSWLHRDIAVLFDRYMGAQWREHPAAPLAHKHITNIPDEELWRVHELGRSRLIRVARDHFERQIRARSAPRSQIAEAKSVLDHDALTIGFARRFATYKRATLLLRDKARLEAILTNDECPVQLVFAGKAHPEDNEGKALIREVIEFARRPSVRRRVVFLENYNINLARYMVQGVDVWLNTPRPPLEASGTSGMKAAANGALNLSSLDGWWAEGYKPNRGWTIGQGEDYQDNDYQDTIEAQAVYNLLEDEVIPCFYDRSGGEVPAAWVQMMKASISMALASFTSHRMVAEYDERFYRPSLEAYKRLMDNGGERASGLVKQGARLSSLWNRIRIEAPTVDGDLEMLHVGDSFAVQAVVHLGELTPDEVDVEVYYGLVDSQNSIIRSKAEKMAPEETRKDGSTLYAHKVTCAESGRYGFTCRAIPNGPDWSQSIPGFLTWAESA